MRIRIKFTKNKSVQYLGHLDIMRTFQRCFNRAGVKMTYSEGFNPHQKMSFALPLGVGIMSRAEYLDAVIADGQNPQEICRNLDLVTGSGFDVLDVRELEETAEKGMACVRYSSYEILFDRIYDFPTEAYLQQPQILIQKKVKTGIREVDAKLLLEEFRCGRTDSADRTLLRVLMKAGSENNLKPELLVSDLMQFSGLTYSRDNISITRTELYADGMIALIDYQTI